MRKIFLEQKCEKYFWNNKNVKIFWNYACWSQFASSRAQYC